MSRKDEPRADSLQMLGGRVARDSPKGAMKLRVAPEPGFERHLEHVVSAAVAETRDELLHAKVVAELYRRETHLPLEKSR